MEKVKYGEYEFVPFIRAEQIAQRVAELAKDVNKQYQGQEPPIVIALLNGPFIFAADLCRQFTFDCDFQLLRVSSYKGMQSTGEVKVDSSAEPIVTDRDVLIIEDIVDTGNTLSAYLPRLWDQGAKSVRVASLLLKPDALQHSLSVDYVGFEIPNDFVIGYGLDYDGKGRNLPHIYTLSQEK